MRYALSLTRPGRKRAWKSPSREPESLTSLWRHSRPTALMAIVSPGFTASRCGICTDLAKHRVDDRVGIQREPRQISGRVRFEERSGYKHQDRPVPAVAHPTDQT